LAWVSRVSTTRAFIVLIDTQFGALLKQLPNKAQTDALLVDINQAGLSRGLPFELLKPAASESAKEFCPELPMQKQEDRADTTRAPFFGELPCIGFLFGSQQSRTFKTELLVFIIPRVVNEQIRVRQRVLLGPAGGRVLPAVFWAAGYNVAVKRNSNIILVGMMGAGKTTVGRILARRLKRAFHDSDHAIEARCGVRVPLIFEIEGEAVFRAREAQLIEELCALEGIVLATGGGAILAPENRRRMADSGLVVYLHGRPADLWQRLRHGRNRPLLATADPLAKLEELYAVRDPLYRETAAIVFDTARQSVLALARDLLAKLEGACRISA